MQGNQAQASPILLTLGEVCDRLRMDRKTVRKLITSGDLKASRGGTGGPKSHYRISEQAVDDFLAARQVQAAS